MAWLAQRKREREIESIFRSRKRISTRFSTKSGMENGRWWRIVAEKRKKKEKEGGEKIRRRHLFPRQKFRAWGMTLVMQAAEHVNVFNCTPFVGYSRLFISRPGVQPWNCTAITACLDSRKNLSRVWARYRFFQSAIDCLRRVSRYHRQRLVFPTGEIFLSVQLVIFDRSSFKVFFFSYRRRLNVNWNMDGFVVVIKIKTNGGFLYNSDSRNIHENYSSV